MKSLRRFLFASAAGIFLLGNAHAQPRVPLKQFGATVTYRGFMSNYEYFNPIVPGFTLFGGVLEPGFSFSADTTWVLFAGAWLLNDFGTEGFRRAEPNIRLEYRRKAWRMRFGSIDIYDQHDLSEWIYDPDDFITRGPAHGAQFNTAFRRLQSEHWVAWRKMIYTTSSEQERLEAGSQINVNLIDDKSGWKVNVPLQGIVFHQGGQIGHIDSSENVVTSIAAAAGVALIKRFLTSGLVESIGVEAQTAWCNNDDDARIGNGFGFYGAASVGFAKGFKSSVGFWHAQDFYVESGSPLYQSRSSPYAQQPVYQSTRRLALLVLEWNRRWQNGIAVDTWLQPHYDLDLEKTEYAYRLRLTYDFDLTLVRE
ncbi:MAG TPA: hypothetical protein VEY71_04760 [Chitinophagales bacterium]|nr:hypothetical protein [Chitinophagales bacterium]